MASRPAIHEGSHVLGFKDDGYLAQTRSHAGPRHQTRGVDQIVPVVTAQRLVSEVSTRTHSVSSIGRSELPARARSSLRAYRKWNASICTSAAPTRNMMAQNVTHPETHLIAFSRQPAVDQERGHMNSGDGVRRRCSIEPAPVIANHM